MEQKEIQELFIMDIKTLKIIKVNINEIDECKFAIFDFNARKCAFNMRGANIKTLNYSCGCLYPQYIVSKDIGSLNCFKSSFKLILEDIGFILRDVWYKNYDEKFNV